MIIRGRLLVVGSLIAALIALAHCNTDEKKDGRAKPLNPNGPSFMRKRQWNGETEPRQLAEIDDRPLLQDPTMTLKSALEHLRLRRQEQQELQQLQPRARHLRLLRGFVWLQ